jgi:hypothetical protein
MAKKIKVDKTKENKKEKLVTLLKNRIPKVFDSEPRGSIMPHLVSKLAEDVLNLK